MLNIIAARFASSSIEFRLIPIYRRRVRKLSRVFLSTDFRHLAPTSIFYQVFHVPAWCSLDDNNNIVPVAVVVGFPCSIPLPLVRVQNINLDPESFK